MVTKLIPNQQDAVRFCSVVRMNATEAHRDVHLFRKQERAGSIPVSGSSEMRVDLLGAILPCQGSIGGFETHYPL